MKEKRKSYYISNKQLGMGSVKRNYTVACISLNEQLAEAIKCFELDTIYTILRMLKERNCSVNRKNQQFLDRFRDD